MLTVSQVVKSTQVPDPPKFLPISPRNAACVCPWCKSLIQHPPLHAVPSLPHVCLLHEPQRVHHILCNDCSKIIALLYYYHNSWRPLIKHPIFKGARLAVYVELERLGATSSAPIPCPVATLARTVGFSYQSTTQALRDLARAGYIQRITLERPHRHLYTILVHQLPKGE